MKEVTAYLMMFATTLLSTTVLAFENAHIGTILGVALIVQGATYLATQYVFEELEKMEE